MASPEQPPDVPKGRKVVRRLNGVIQIGGLVVFINEAMIRHGEARTFILAICALAIMGSEAGKDFLLRIFDHTLGGGEDG